MRTAIVDFPVPEIAKTNGPRLLAFLCCRILKAHARTLGALLLPPVLLLAVVALVRAAEPVHAVMYAFRIALLGLCLALVSISEEFGHAAAAIRKNLDGVVRDLRVSYWTRRGWRALLVLSYGVHLKGQMTERDLLQITAAGPLLALSVGCMFLLGFWCWGGNVLFTDPVQAPVASLLVLLPLISLTPIGHLGPFPFVHSDGDRIADLKVKHSMGTLAISREMARGLGFVLAFVARGKPPATAWTQPEPLPADLATVAVSGPEWSREGRNAVCLDRVWKSYGATVAVRDVSFTIQSGTIFGLIGPNGAGKTTIIRMIMNIIAPDQGEITIEGNPSTQPAARSVGYLPEERGLYRRMKVLDQLVFLAEIRGVRAREARSSALRWLERFHLEGTAGKRVEELSKGQQQFVQFVGCLLHEPRILALDEPFSGLDPISTSMLRDAIMELRAQGTTLIVSTHIMERVEQLCETLAVIDKGRIVLCGTMAEVMGRDSRTRLTIGGQGTVARLREIHGVRAVQETGRGINVELEKGTRTTDFLREACSVFDIETVESRGATLEEIFLEVTRGRGSNEEEER